MVEAAGADIVEVGVPFSDPLADGVTIQRSTQAALDQGMTATRVLELIHQAALKIPVVIMTYLNPVLAYGLDRFLADAHAAGASGLLLTDFPAGADPDLERRVTASPLALIRLIAPTTTQARVARAVEGASGFIYLISRLGVTGMRDDHPVGRRVSRGSHPRRDAAAGGGGVWHQHGRPGPRRGTNRRRGGRGERAGGGARRR